MKKEVFSIAININGQEVMFDADNNQVFCTSIDIAKVFGKRHDNILNLIGDKLKNKEIENFNLLNFKEIKYNDNRGRLYPCYKLTRDGFSFIVMGLTGSKADKWKVAFIKAFNQMESMLRTYEEQQFLKNTQKEVFNLKYESHCKDIILKQIKREEEDKKAKCVNVNCYRVEEVFDGHNVRTTLEWSLDFDKDVKYELNKPKITKGKMNIEENNKRRIK